MNCVKMCVVVWLPSHMSTRHCPQSSHTDDIQNINNNNSNKTQ